MGLSSEAAARSGLIPLERELRERLAWFIQLRWLAALGITVGAWGATEFIVVDLSPLPLYVRGGPGRGRVQCVLLVPAPPFR